MVNFAQEVIHSMEYIKPILQLLVNGPSTANDLDGLFPSERRSAIFRGLGWMLKLGLLKTCL